MMLVDRSNGRRRLFHHPAEMQLVTRDEVPCQRELQEKFLNL